MSGEITIIPLRGVRGMIADKLLKSLQETAQLTHHASADMSTLLARKANLAQGGDKVSVEDLLIEATLRAVALNPAMNGTVVGREIRLSAPVHLSIAMAMPDNTLVAPALFDAQSKSLSALRSARRDLAARAKTNKLTASEMTQGTLCVSNLGLSRVHHFTPILNAPQIAIIGFGCTQDRVVKARETLETRPFIGLSLTFDHRAVDGAPAAKFLTDICLAIETA